MAARDAHLRRIHAHEAIYGGTKPEPRPFITDRDVIDAQHKFLRDNDNEETDPFVKEYYESLIKDCVLVDLSRYREKKVAMRWRTIDEVKAGKGDKSCANVACERTEDLQPLEVVFGYMEEGKAKNVLVKCVVCERCRKKMRKAQGKEKEKESKSRPHRGEEKDEDRRKRRRHHHESDRNPDSSEKQEPHGSSKGNLGKG